MMPIISATLQLKKAGYLAKIVRPFKLEIVMPSVTSDQLSEISRIAGTKFIITAEKNAVKITYENESF